MILRTIPVWWQPFQLFHLKKRQTVSQRGRGSGKWFETRASWIFSDFFYVYDLCIIHDKTSSNKSSSAIESHESAGGSYEIHTRTYQMCSFVKINKGSCCTAESRRVNIKRRNRIWHGLRRPVVTVIYFLCFFATNLCKDWRDYKIRKLNSYFHW